MLKTTSSSHPPFAMNGSSETTVLMQSDTQNIAEDIPLQALHNSDEENVTQKPDRYEVVPKPMVEMLKTTSSSHPSFATNGSSETTVLMQSDTQNIAEDISLPEPSLIDFNLEPKTVPGSFMSNMCSSSTLIKQNSRINNSGISEIKYLCELMKSNEINFSDDSDSEIGNIFNSTISSLCNSKHSEITFDKVSMSPASDRASPEFLPGCNLSKNIDHIVDQNMTTPLNDSGIVYEKSVDIIDTDDDTVDCNHSISEKNGEDNLKTKKYKKPVRPCIFCNVSQAQLKRHILSKHAKHNLVKPLLSMNSTDQDREIAKFRRLGIRNYNIAVLESDGNSFMRERKNDKDQDELPLICSGCNGFFSRTYKARHQLICSAAGSNLMMPLVSVSSSLSIDNYSDGFKSLLNTLRLDEVGDYIKTDKIVLMIGARSFGALKRRKDKITETLKSVRARMRLVARIYLSFREIYCKQLEVRLANQMNDASDMYRREVILILGQAINLISERNEKDVNHISITGQKSGLKISILNLIKLSAKFLIGHFLMENLETNS